MVCRASGFQCLHHGSKGDKKRLWYWISTSLQSTGRAGTNSAVFSIPSKNHLLLKTQCSLHGSIRNGFLLHVALNRHLLCDWEWSYMYLAHSMGSPPRTKVRYGSLVLSSVQRPCAFQGPWPASPKDASSPLSPGCSLPKAVVKVGYGQPGNSTPWSSEQRELPSKQRNLHPLLLSCIWMILIAVLAERSSSNCWLPISTVMLLIMGVLFHSAKLISSSLSVFDLAEELLWENTFSS